MRRQRDFKSLCLRQFIISLGLVFPRITVLCFVITYILLSSITVFVNNAKVAAVQDPRVCAVLYFECKNASGVFGIIVSETLPATRVGQGLFNQTHEKVTNRRPFLPGRVYFPRRKGYNRNRDKENLSSKE